MIALVTASTTTAAFARKLQSPGVLNPRAPSICRKGSDYDGGGVVVVGVAVVVGVEVDERFENAFYHQKWFHGRSRCHQKRSHGNCFLPTAT